MSCVPQAVADYRAMGLTARADHTAGLADGDPVQPVPSTARWVREGDFWRVSYVGREATVKHGKGMTDLAVLLSRPGQEVHVLDLLAPGVTTPAGDLGDVVDDQARAAYRHRLEELDRLADEAAADGDDRVASRLSEERDQLVAALASAYGIGGRVRRAGNPAERARTTVTSRLRDAIDRVAAAHDAARPAPARLRAHRHLPQLRAGSRRALGAVSPASHIVGRSQRLRGDHAPSSRRSHVRPDRFLPRTDRIEDFAALDDQWVRDTGGRRTLVDGALYRDRGDARRYWSINYFPSYEEAMVNSSLPETTAFAEQAMARSDGPAEFVDLDLLTDLDVRRTRAAELRSLLETNNDPAGLLADDSGSTCTSLWRVVNRGTDGVMGTLVDEAPGRSFDRYDVHTTADGFVAEYAYRTAATTDQPRRSRSAWSSRP